jgi:hypothetical protein
MMNGEPLTILLVEDNRAELIQCFVHLSPGSGGDS